MTRQKTISVAVCIATYRRPEKLKTLLVSLEKMRLPEAPPVEIVFIVVDNDRDGSAAEVVKGFSSRLPGEVKYAVEPRQGITYARNRGIALAKAAEWVALVDDDETVAPDWLANLLWAADYYRAEVVQGPVVPQYQAVLPDWIEPGHYLIGKAAYEGELLNDARSGNILLKNSLLQQIPGPLDERLNRSGGGDTLLTRQLKQRGAKIIHTNRAVVEEERPAERLTLKWMFKRNYRIGNTNALIRRYLEGGIAWRFYFLLLGCGRMVQALLLILGGAAGKKSGLYRGVLAAGLGLGNWAAVLGKTYEEYTPDRMANGSD